MGPHNFVCLCGVYRLCLSPQITTFRTKEPFFQRSKSLARTYKEKERDSQWKLVAVKGSDRPPNSVFGAGRATEGAFRG